MYLTYFQLEKIVSWIFETVCISVGTSHITPKAGSKLEGEKKEERFKRGLDQLELEERFRRGLDQLELEE